MVWRLPKEWGVKVSHGGYPVRGRKKRKGSDGRKDRRERIVVAGR